MKKLLLISLILSASKLYAVSFVPKNNLRIPVDATRSSEINEMLFLKIISNVKEVYKDKSVSTYHDWKDPEVNAFADIYNEERYVMLYGGFARHKDMTPDGFALVVCHEFAHHLGGRPRMTNMSWGASSEGQADYFGVNNCLKKYFRLLNNSDEPSDNILEVPEIVETRCSNNFSDEIEKNICTRAAMAGVSLGTVLGKISDPYYEYTPKLDSPSSYVVAKTKINGYPSVQCRLDTYFAASLNLIRPACWFKE